MTHNDNRHEIHESGAKGVIRFELAEMLAAFEESFDDLTDEQAQAFPLPGGHNITWCVMHCIENHNWYLVESQGGTRLLLDDWDHTRWNWQSPMPTPDQTDHSTQRHLQAGCAACNLSVSRLTSSLATA